jgi:hypothetical protein
MHAEHPINRIAELLPWVVSAELQTRTARLIQHSTLKTPDAYSSTTMPIVIRFTVMMSLAPNV